MAPLHLGTFELLSGGRYVSRDMGGKSLGSGEYTYDAKSMQVSWTSGPFLDNKWGGRFEIQRDGKSHQIRFTRSTTGTNSSDSK